MGLIAVILAGFGWAAYDMSRPSAPPPIGFSSLDAVLSGSRPVLLEFYADWCGPCKMVGPEVDKLAGELRGKAEVIRLNVDENHQLAEQYGVSSIPCFIAFKRGKETARAIGSIPRERMRAMIGL